MRLTEHSLSAVRTFVWSSRFVTDPAIYPVQTANYLTIPTVFKAGRLEIVMHGETSLELSTHTALEVSR